MEFDHSGATAPAECNATRGCIMATTAQLLFDEPSEDVSPRSIVEPPTQLQPEEHLMLAVLRGAVSDFQTYATAPSGRGRQIFIEADAWFQAAATDAFTFEMICHALGLDPDFIRAGLRRWYRERRRRPTLMSRAVAAPSRAGASSGHLATMIGVCES
jgi:hypothetical protein